MAKNGIQCGNIQMQNYCKKQAKRQKNTKLVQNKAKGAKIFLTV